MQRHHEDRRHAAFDPPLGARDEQIRDRAQALFALYYERLREEHEEMRQARRMRQLRHENRSGTSPALTTLLSSIDNVVADQIDNLPEARMIPEREETMQSAQEMTDVVSYVLYHAGWPGKYQKIMEDAVVTGTGVAQVFWDEELEDGEGMVSVLCWHPEDFYPDPMYEDIQDGRGVFKVTHTTVSWVEAHYPHAQGYVSGDPYARRDEPEAMMAVAAMSDGDEPTTLIEYWYKTLDEGRTHVHMAQLAGGALLYSSETGFGTQDGMAQEQGLYAHGQYPFTLYRYRDVWRRPFGSGLVHDYRQTQEAIDRYCKYIDDNARESSIQRHFVRRGSGVSAEDVADMSKTVIEWEGSDIREVLQTVQSAPLNHQVYSMMQYLADSMKQDSGQNQFARGEGGMNVTAGTAIYALQAAGSKIARWHTERFKDAFREMVEQIIWVMSEYMDEGRTLRIVGGAQGEEHDRLIELAAPRSRGDALLRPAYSVRVQVQRNNPDEIREDNDFLLRAMEVCAKSGVMLPPQKIIGLMKGQRMKGSVLKLLEETQQADDGNAQQSLKEGE